MTDAELRALVRDAVARYMTDAGPARAVNEPAGPPWRHHASHGQYLTIVNVGDACVIEPSATCDHCGYCKSHGH